MKFATGLSRRDRRALSAGAAIVGAVLLTRLTVPVLDLLTRVREANQAASDRLAFSQQDLAALGATRDTLAARVVRLARADSLLLSPGSPAHVASELGAIVRDASRTAGLELLGATTQSDSVVIGTFQRAVVRLEAQGDVSGLMQFLLLVELAPGLLDVRELSVTPVEPAAGDDRAEVIRVSIAIEGVARSPGTSHPGVTP
jgi:hypothetical protein